MGTIKHLITLRIESLSITEHTAQREFIARFRVNLRTPSEAWSEPMAIRLEKALKAKLKQMGWETS